MNNVTLINNNGEYITKQIYANPNDYEANYYFFTKALEAEKFNVSLTDHVGISANIGKICRMMTSSTPSSSSSSLIKRKQD